MPAHVIAEYDPCIVCEAKPDPIPGRPRIGKREFIRGLCSKCYYRSRKDGSLEKVALPNKNHVNQGRPVGSRTLTKHGYINVKISEDGEFKQEHRLVMEEHLGRELTPMESVHHINGVRHDNRLENLELWASAHPYGQRVSQLIEYIAEFHAEEMKKALGLTN